jgi:uncharacterized protein YpmS
MQHKNFLGQRAFYGGVILGILLVLVAGLVAELVFSSQNQSASVPAPQSGNVTIDINQQALDLGMQLALKQVQPQLPFTITSISTTLRAGDEVDVTINGQPILGITPAAIINLSPVVASDGSLDFRVQQVQLSNLNLSLGSAVDQAIEQAINQQFSSYGRGDLVNGLHYQLVDVRTTTNSLILTAQLTSG